MVGRVWGGDQGRAGPWGAGERGPGKPGGPKSRGGEQGWRAHPQAEQVAAVSCSPDATFSPDSPTSRAWEGPGALGLAGATGTGRTPGLSHAQGLVCAPARGVCSPPGSRAAAEVCLFWLSGETRASDMAQVCPGTAEVPETWGEGGAIRTQGNPTVRGTSL